VDVASRLEACQRRWGLKRGSRLGGGFRSEVFPCSAAGGEQVVVKLAPTPGEARLEAAALALWAHTGAAVVLIDADVSHGALLLERIWPGQPAARRRRPGQRLDSSRRSGETASGRARGASLPGARRHLRAA
jgi:hypothetical protein